MISLGLNLDRIRDPGSWVTMYPTVLYEPSVSGRLDCLARTGFGLTIEERDSGRPFDICHIEILLHSSDSSVGD